CLNDCTAAACGDTSVQAGVEECDDGNLIQTDSCLNDCTAAACGDTYVQAGVEECDDGNLIQTDSCLNDCTAASCGDTYVQAGVEDCDGGDCCDGSCSFRLSTFECRAAAGDCDVAETCTGASATCPIDVFKSSGTVCRSSSESCDPQEVCDGLSISCPSDTNNCGGGGSKKDCTIETDDGSERINHDYTKDPLIINGDCKSCTCNDGTTNCVDSTSPECPSVCESPRIECDGVCCNEGEECYNNECSNCASYENDDITFYDCDEIEGSQNIYYEIIEDGEVIDQSLKINNGENCKENSITSKNIGYTTTSGTVACAEFEKICYYCSDYNCPTGQIYNADLEKCVDDCPEGQYYDESLNTCVEGCKEGNTCTVETCPSFNFFGYTLEISFACETQQGVYDDECNCCPRGEFYDSELGICREECSDSEEYNVETGKCESCVEGAACETEKCYTFLGFTIYCVTVEGSNIIENGECVCQTDCVAPKFYNPSGECVECDDDSHIMKCVGTKIEFCQYGEILYSECAGKKCTDLKTGKTVDCQYCEEYQYVDAEGNSEQKARCSACPDRPHLYLDSNGKCVCSPGYTMNQDGYCVDEDECDKDGDGIDGRYLGVDCETPSDCNDADPKKPDQTKQLITDDFGWLRNTECPNGRSQGESWCDKDGITILSCKQDEYDLCRLYVDSLNCEEFRGAGYVCGDTIETGGTATKANCVKKQPPIYPPLTTTCGNGVVDDGEQCDGDKSTCEDEGYFKGGDINCFPPGNINQCKWNNTNCSNCGNNIKDDGEECDSNDFGNQDCETFNKINGNLKCTNQCKIELNCEEPTCNNDGIKDPNELCDGNDLRGKTCEDFGLISGVLKCADCIFDKSECLEPNACNNNGFIDPGEQCDVFLPPNTLTCQQQGFLFGNVWCDNDCQIDDNCGNNPPPCNNDGILDPGEMCDTFLPNWVPNCQQQGFQFGNVWCNNCQIDDDCNNIKCNNNGNIDPGEQCDVLLPPGTLNCQQQGFQFGNVWCDNKCRIEDNCGNIPPPCNNDGILDPGEQCDVFLPQRTPTCQQRGFQFGNTWCDNSCQIDDNCNNNGFICGDGIQDPGEQCDGNLPQGTLTCQQQGFRFGNTWCNNDCQIDDNCDNNAICGNNLIEGREECDGKLPSWIPTCQQQGFLFGNVWCDNNCRIDDSCNNECGESCQDLGYECGTVELCGELVECGTCDFGQVCENNICIENCDLCTEGDRRCAYGDVQECISDSGCTTWVTIDDCNDNDVCTIDSCSNAQCEYENVEDCDNVCVGEDCGKVVCDDSIEQFSMKRYAGGQEILLEEGRVFIYEPRELGCLNKDVKLSFMIPGTFTDYEVHICKNGICEKRRAVEDAKFYCDEVLTDRFKRSDLYDPDDALKTITPKKFTSLIKFVNIGDNSLTFGKNFEGVKAEIGYLTNTVQQPENEFIKIIGQPIKIKLSTDNELSLDVKLKYNNIENIKEDSLMIYARVNNRWIGIGGLVDDENKEISVSINNFNEYFREDNEVILSIMGTMCEDCNDNKLHKVYSDEESNVAVVFVHGFNGNVYSYEDMYNEFALTRQKLDVWAYEYETIFDIDKISDDLLQLSETNLNTYRDIIFIGHSLGGLVIQKALEEAEYKNYMFIDNVKSVLLLGSPNKGLPYIKETSQLINTIINSESVGTVFNLNSPTIQELKEGIREINRVSGVKYFVTAGTEPYYVELFGYKLDSSYVLGLDGTNDGLVLSKDARNVGGEEVNNMCENYWEFRLTHSELDDNVLSRDLMKQIISKEAELGDGFGLSKRISVNLNDCSSGDVLYITGLPYTTYENECVEKFAKSYGSLFDRYAKLFSILLWLILLSIVLISTYLVIRHNYKKTNAGSSEANKVRKTTSLNEKEQELVKDIHKLDENIKNLDKKYKNLRRKLK
ncbi:hypothetical protein KY334_02765, partial [Candidatus Woesearchaeota archaeon]|nr:hypothetical protein [Candidatus Woesearchaeota archaeon]